MTVFEKVCALLDVANIKYEVSKHEPVFTSEEAARVRGTPMESGAKALVCKAGKVFQMFVMPANLKLDTKKVRKTLGIQKLRFATREELYELTGLEPGCVPPFGSLFALATWCDSHLANQPQINFNAGDHGTSVGMSFNDYLKTESPTVAEIAK